MHPQMQHDPTRPLSRLGHTVSIQAFRPPRNSLKSLAVMEEMAEKDVTYNDLVWVIQIQLYPPAS